VPYEDDELVAELDEVQQEARGWLQPAIVRLACPVCDMEKEEPEDSCWCVLCGFV
jgi:5,10-methenyltetrahydromethanopterin hydrogenase